MLNVGLFLLTWNYDNIFQPHSQPFALLHNHIVLLPWFPNAK